MIILNQANDLTLKSLVGQIESLDALKMSESTQDTVNFVNQPE